MPPRNRNAALQTLNFLVAILLAVIPLLLSSLLDDPQPYHDSALTGQMRYDELMNSDNPNLFLDVTRMSKECFILLLDFMRTRGSLMDSNHICAGQKLMIFITMLKGKKNREIHYMWQHSGSTISYILDEVLAAFELVQDRLMIAPTIGVPDEIRNDPRFFPFFENCRGALDGSHIDCFTTDPLYRNRKKTMSQNVLAVVNFDLIFSYVLAGIHIYIYMYLYLYTYIQTYI
jgi:hypothetical protein